MIILTFTLSIFIFSCTGNSIDLNSSEMLQLDTEEGENLFSFSDDGCKGYYCASISLNWESKISELELLEFGQWLYEESEVKITENNNITGKNYRIKIYHPPAFQKCKWSNSNECNNYLIAFYFRDLPIHQEGVVKIYLDKNNVKEYSQPILNSQLKHLN